MHPPGHFGRVSIDFISFSDPKLVNFAHCFIDNPFSASTGCRFLFPPVCVLVFLHTSLSLKVFFGPVGPVSVQCQWVHLLFCFLAGHHTFYIGVHVPKSYRRRRRHRRRATHKDKKEKLAENASDKSDTENNDDTSNSILKPLSK